MLLSPSQIIQAIKKILHHEGIGIAQLSVVFVTSQRMKSLNKKYLNDSYATDVLAFDFLHSSKPKKSLKPKELNGEIIISTGAACRQAKLFHNSQKRELMLYVIHGILHLLGFDDHCPKDIKRFRAREETILTFLKA
jgi:probable rRNA maturation factor